MTGGRSSPVRPAPGRYSIFAFHDKVRRWMTLRTGLTQEAAVRELLERQDRIRRRSEPCRVVVLEDGEEPQ